MRAVFLVLALALLFTGCGASQQYPAVPADLNERSVPHDTLALSAERYHFTPEEVHVPQGALVTLKITALDGTHGFSLGAFGIDETIPERESRSVTFYAAKKGEFDFRCSHICGIGHLGMTGKIIVD